MQFKLLHIESSTKARVGELATSHGRILTPVFMPVGTAGTVKAVHQRELKHDIKAPVILGNTYHLYLRPGTDIIENAGGLHKFISWDGPILTDSGGYQIYSLSQTRKISEEGVKFQSHIDGSEHLFTPESAVNIQRTIGADIIMAFDECTPYPCEYDYAKNSIELTHRWLERCVNKFNETKEKYDYSQSLFSIVQGSTFADLRQKSAEVISSFNLGGNAIGGLSVGEPDELMYQMTELVCEILPENKPRYLMGVGTPANILECIALGVDMFDCVIPTRNARHGMVFTKNGIINIKNEKWKNDHSPLEAESDLYYNGCYSKAYVRHLILSNEMLGAQITSVHNLHFYLWLVSEARNQILNNTFLVWKNLMVKQLMQRL